MTDRELEQRLAQALDRAAPDDLEGVLSRCETRKGKVIQMTTGKKRPLVRDLLAACLALVLLGGTGAVYQQNYAVASIVSLDVNPSIELTVNKNEKVLSCRGLNEDAQTVLADMKGGEDLEGTKLDVAVNAIVGALVRHGHLDSLSSAILISVEDKDQARAEKLQAELAAAVDVVLQDKAAEVSVLSQTVAKDTRLEKLARENNISTGKAALVEQVLALNSRLDFDALTRLTVEELRDMAETGAGEMPIGRDEAARLAKKYAGVSDSDLRHTEVDAELDDAIPHYDVDLYTALGEYEYTVDAYSGQILRGREDILSAPAPTVAPKPTVTPKPVETPRPAETPRITIAATATDIPATSSDLPKSTAGAEDIGSARAKAIALSHAGLTESQVTGLRAERDYDDGRLEYEVEFKSGGMEYEYTIHGSTGAVLEHERDRDD